MAMPAEADLGAVLDVVLPVPRPLLDSCERLVRAGLAESREDLLRRWLLDGWRLNEEGRVPSPGERLHRQTKPDRPRR